MRSFAILLHFIVTTLQENVEEREEVNKKWEEDKFYWDNQDLDLCSHLSSASAPLHLNMSCYRRRLLVEYVDVEVYSERPVVMRIRRFVGTSVVDGIKGAAHATNSEDPWLQQDDPAAIPLLKRIQQVIRLNPEIAEDFMIFKYGVLDNTRPHYDYLSPTGPHYDERRLEGLGNRLATTLLVVKTATKGGGTLFPSLRTVVQPEAGDLLLRFNADSNEVREDGSVHAGCPVEKGEKVALTLWFRSKYQDGLQCSTQHAGYVPLDLLKRGEKHENDYFIFDEIM